jgi:hypothetical protein
MIYIKVRDIRVDGVDFALICKSLKTLLRNKRSPMLFFKLLLSQNLGIIA